VTDLAEVGPEHAAEVLAVILRAFGDRPVLDPPATALTETYESVAAELAEHGGLLAVQDGEPVGALLFADSGRLLGLRRVGVLSGARRAGVASLLAERAETVARQRGYSGLAIEARTELPRTVRFWHRHGYVEVERDGPRLHLQRLLPVVLRLPLPEDTQAVGRALGRLLQAGDLLILTGDLGAGKTTFTQGLGEGLGIRGPVTSPTFVIARVHPSLVDGPALIHVDAYRLGDAAELDDLDLDTDLDEAVTVVEWGSGLAETLSAVRLDLALTRAADDVRTLTVTALGGRWTDVDLGSLI
jgi:tRNA threonylcarbamoyladenosine biosynthesis protein TsaE